MEAQLASGFSKFCVHFTDLTMRVHEACFRKHACTSKG